MMDNLIASWVGIMNWIGRRGATGFVVLERTGKSASQRGLVVDLGYLTDQSEARSFMMLRRQGVDYQTGGSHVDASPRHHGHGDMACSQGGFFGMSTEVGHILAISPVTGRAGRSFQVSLVMVGLVLASISRAKAVRDTEERGWWMDDDLQLRRSAGTELV